MIIKTETKQLALLLFASFILCQKICPKTAPAQVIKLPDVLPCRSSKLYSGEIVTSSFNSELYITNATLVIQKECHSVATYYFFGSHVCEQFCIEVDLTEEEARGLRSGFCPDIDGKHVKYNNLHSSKPTCSFIWPRTTNTVTISCNKFTGHVSYTHLQHPVSSLGHIESCDYYKGVCKLSVGRWMFWDVDERSKISMIKSPPQKALCDGNRVWFPKPNLGFGLINQTCTWTNYTSTVEGINLKWVNPPIMSLQRSRRDNHDQILSLAEFLYGEITYQDDPFCESMMGIVSASSILPHSNPTKYAELLLKNQAVYAESSGSYLFIWYCETVETSPRNGSSCHVHPRVSIMINGTKEPAYLGSGNQIIVVSPSVDCTDHILTYHLNGYPYIENGGLSYQLHISTLNHIYTKPLGSINPNYTGIFPKTPSLYSEIRDLQDNQATIIMFTRSLGANIRGSGGGLSGANIPGLKHGLLPNIVALFQTVGAIGGCIYLLCRVIKFILVSGETTFIRV